MKTAIPFKPSLLLLSLMAVILTPATSHAQWVVTDLISDAESIISDVFNDLTSVASSDGAVSDSLTAADEDYEDYFNDDSSVGVAAAYVPGDAISMSALHAKTVGNAEAQQYRLDQSRDTLRQHASVVELSPRTIQKFLSDLKSGNIMTQITDMLENKWKDIEDGLVNKYGEQALEKYMDNFVTDLLSCKTPQLQTAFPSVNLDLGVSMCDYKSMFDNMKGQVKTLTKKGWGGTFNINGRPASDIIKDPSSLTNAIQMVSPGQGHAIVADFLSDASINQSIQAKIDAQSIAQDLQSQAQKQTLERQFKDRTIQDSVDEQTTVAIKAASATNALLAAQTTNQTTQLTSEQIRDQIAEAARLKEQMVANATEGASDVTNY